jgi:hypothetical protein
MFVVWTVRKTSRFIEKLLLRIIQTRSKNMRYYDLDINGKVKGSYAVLQPGKNLVLLEDAPDDESRYDGSTWVADTDKVNARLAEEARIAAKAQALIGNLPSWAAVSNAIDAADTLPKLRAIVKKLARVLYWQVHDKEE